MLVVLGLGLSALAFSSVKASVENMLSRWLAGSEVHFDVPDRPVPLYADVVLGEDRITICNRSHGPWANILIRITDRVSNGNVTFDVTRFAEPGTVAAGKCIDVPKAAFHSAGWKKIPARREMNIVRVEILASVKGQGYFIKEESPSGGAPK